MKKSISYLLVFLILANIIFTMPLIVYADEPEIIASGSFETDFTWELDSNNRLWIYGSGNMKNWDMFNTPPWKDYSQTVRKVIIENGITSIGSESFDSFKALLQVDIPKSVTAINDSAFIACSNLMYLILPDNLEYIGRFAFTSCNSIESVILPEKLLSLGNCAFSGCKNLKKVHIPGSIDSIGQYAFQDCEKLNDVTISAGIEGIGEGAFENCASLKSIVIPEGTTWIGQKAFYHSGLERITIPKSMAYIRNSAIANMQTSETLKIYYCDIMEQWNSIEIEDENYAIEYADFIYGVSSDGLSFNNDVDINSNYDPLYMPEGINNITINGKGDAIGRFKVLNTNGEPVKNKWVLYCLDNKMFGEALTNEHGYASVEISDITESKEYKVKFIGDDIQNTEGTINVTVEPLHFKNIYESYLNLGAKVGVGLGAGGSIGNLGAEAKLAEIGAGASKKMGFTLSQEYLNNKNKLILSAQRNYDFLVDAKMGLFAKADIDGIDGIRASIGDISGGASYGNVATVGYEDTNFKLSDDGDVTDIAKFLVVAIMSNNVSNALAKHIADKIDAPVNYFENGNVVSLNSGANVGLIEAGGANISLYGRNGRSIWSNTTKTFKDKSKEYSSGLSVENGESIFKVDVGIDNGFGTSVSKAGSLFNGDLLIEANENKDGNLDNLTLWASSAKTESFLISQKQTTSKTKLTFEGDNANGVSYLYQPLRAFSKGNKGFFTIDQLKNATDALVSNNFTGRYAQVKNVKKGKELNLSASLQLGVEIGGEIGISGAQSYEYDLENGMMENGILYIQGNNKIDDLVESEIITIEQLLDAAKNIARELVQKTIEKAEQWLDEAEQSAVRIKKAIVSKIKTTKSSGSKQKVTIQTTADNMETTTVLAVADEILPISASSQAVTIGNPYIIEVTDENSNTLTDFKEQPLLLELEYAQADLDKAMVDDTDKISILRWDADKNCYVNMGGELNKELKKVSLEITLPGQYILAVDNMEPSITLFNQSHNGKNPVISAYVSDFSSISELTMKLDGETIINADNLDKYYDHATGLLKYESSLTEAGEYNFTIYAKDSFQNETEQNYIVEVMSDVPDINNVTYLGNTLYNRTAITAKVSGDEISNVYLNVKAFEPSGDTYKLCLNMIKTGDKYSVQMPDIKDGSVIELYVSAFNKYGNMAESSKQICMLDYDFEPKISIYSVEDGIVTVKTSNIYDTAKIYLAAYDKNGALTNIYSKELDYTVAFDNVETAHCMKAFAVKDNLKPICKPFTMYN